MPRKKSGGARIEGDFAVIAKKDMKLFFSGDRRMLGKFQQRTEGDDETRCLLPQKRGWGWGWSSIIAPPVGSDETSTVVANFTAS